VGQDEHLVKDAAAQVGTSEQGAVDEPVVDRSSVGDVAAEVM